VDERIDPASARAELIGLCLTGVSNPAASAGLHEVIEFHIGAETFHIQINDGKVRARSGPSAEPAGVRVQCDLETFMALGLHQITPADALRDGRARLPRGSPEAFSQVFNVLEYKP